MKRKKLNFFYLAIVFLTLVLLTTCFISNLYARYTTYDSFDDSSVVAKFDITESFDTTETFPIKIKPGDSITRKIIINNNSDVTINVIVIVENVTNNLPLTFSCEEQLIAPHKKGEVTVIVSWDSTYSSYEFAEMVDVIKFNLTAKQFD